MVKIHYPGFSYWAWSTCWGHVLSPKSFCRILILGWEIRYANFQPTKSIGSLEFVCSDQFLIFWHLVVKFGYDKWFLSNKKSSVFPFRWIISEIKKSWFQFFEKNKISNFFLLDITFLIQKNYQKFFFEKIEIMIFLFHL